MKSFLSLLYFAFPTIIRKLRKVMLKKLLLHLLLPVIKCIINEQCNDQEGLVKVAVGFQITAIGFCIVGTVESWFYSCT